MTFPGSVVGNAIRSAIIRASTVLTGAYVTGLTHHHEGFNTLYLDCEVTKGNATEFDFKVEKSEDKVTWYRQNQRLSSGTLTDWNDDLNTHVIASATENPSFELSIVAKYVRISVIGVTASDYVGSLLKITARSVNLVNH
jgi:hypothetical protein